MQKEIAYIEFVHGVKFKFIGSLKNSGTKYLLNFDDSCEGSGNSKAFIEIATPGRHLALSTIYIKHNLFHQIKLGRDVELIKTHIFLPKSARDVMQVSSLSVHWGFGLELVCWHQDATTVPYGQFLIDL